MKTRIIKGLIYLLSLAILLPVIFFSLVYNGFFGKVPGEAEITNIKNLEASVVYGAQGLELGKFYLQDRTLVSLDEISPFLLDALVATEDKRFYSHKGIDFRSLMRVVVKSLLMQKSSGGGSTITLQLAKNLFPRTSYKYFYYPINKTREAIIAYRIEAHYSKDEILDLYLNTVSFGEDVYGVESASHRFFDCSAKDLAHEQAAVLIGMLKATTSYNPALHQEASLARRNIVISQMAKAEFITSDVADSLSALEIKVHYQPRNKQSSRYILAQVKTKVGAFLKEYNKEHEIKLNLLTDGLKIFTTVDKGMQQHAEEALHQHMLNLQKIFDKHWYDKDLWSRHTKLLNREIKKNSNGRTPLQMQEKRAVYHYNPEGTIQSKMSPIDSIKYYLTRLQAGFLAMQPRDGAIKSWVGGIDYQYFPYDHVNYSAKRQVGSTFKPIVYAAALEAGISPCRYYEADQASYEVKEGEYKPANDDADYEGKYTMEGALEGSVNTVSVKILNDVGITETIELAKRMGVRSTIPEVLSIALGTPSISLLEMVTVYSSFVNGGYAVQPHLIDRIEDSNGNILYQYENPVKKRVLTDKTSRLMTHLLEGVVDDGTGRSIRTRYKLTNAIGGKTGTTQNNADGWFMAVTPKLVAGAWVGGIYPEISFTDTRLGQGATMALPIFAKFYTSLNQEEVFNTYTHSKFKALRSEWENELDCDPFKEDFNLMNWLFGKEKKKDKTAKPSKKKVEEEGIFKKIGKFFKKKDK